MDTAILKLHCPDKKGLVYEIGNFIYRMGCNIITSSQHNEELDQRFFMRVHFSLEGTGHTLQHLKEEFALIANMHGMEYEITTPSIKKKMAVLVSKYDHCLYDLFLRQQYGELNVEISLVISNHPDLKHIAKNFNTPYYHIPIHSDKSNSVEVEKETLKIFEKCRVDFVVLARYMQILGPTLLNAYPNKIINVHHGFLPAFKGARPYHQAYEKGVKLIGATSHYANEDLDMGPIICQEVLPVDHTHSVEDMLSMGRDIERQVLARAIRSYVDDKIIVYNNRTIIFR